MDKQCVIADVPCVGASVFASHLEVAMQASTGARERLIRTWRPRFAGTTPTILLVDDDPAVRQLWKDILCEAAPKAHFVDAEDGASAVQLATKIEPDVIVMDFRMPIMNGLDATKQLKAARSTARIPVILVTGMECPVQNVLDAGCHSFVKKPFLPDELVEEVARALRLS